MTTDDKTLRWEAMEAEQRKHAETVAHLEDIAGALGPYRQFDFTAHLAKWMTEHGFATGHGDCFDDLLADLSWQIEELRAASRKSQ